MPDTGKNIHVHVFVSGIVQGVYFRAHARDEALSLGLAGWVKNTDDGRVEIKAEGPREKTDDFILWCHKGPSGARVAGVDVTEETPSGGFSGFRIIY